MKKILAFAACLLTAVVAWAQTPAEIVSRMDEEMNKHESEGIIMTMEIKIPLLGTVSSQNWIRDDKFRTEFSAKGIKYICWSDGKTTWTYNGKDNEVVIENAKEGSSSGGADDAKMLTGITDGYDITLKKETADAWYFLCKKSKTNPDGDDPKKMDLVVAKGTYYPKSLSASMSGVTTTLRDIAFGVSDEDLTFDAADYPGVKIVDKRK